MAEYFLGSLHGKIARRKITFSENFKKSKYLIRKARNVRIKPVFGRIQSLKFEIWNITIHKLFFGHLIEFWIFRCEFNDKFRAQNWQEIFCNIITKLKTIPENAISQETVSILDLHINSFTYF